MAATGIIAQFKKCPWCGKRDPLSERILGPLRAVAKVAPSYEWYPVMNRLQPPIDPSRPPLIGSMLPSATICSDICCSCGRQYVVKIMNDQVVITNIQSTQN